MPGAERHTNVLTNVWANQGSQSVQMSSLCRHNGGINTKMLADRQRKLYCLPTVI